MSFTNPVHSLGTVTSGLMVKAPTSGIFTAPLAGQLILTALRVPMLTTPSVAPTVLALNGLGSTVNVFTPIGTPVTVGTTTGTYEQLYYAIAGGTEASLSCTWAGTAASTAAGAAFLEYDEFDGFVGTPTLSVDQQLSSTSNSTGFNLVSSANETETPVLAVCHAALANLSGAWTSVPPNDFFVGSDTAHNFTLTGGTGTSYTNLGWVSYANSTGAVDHWNMAWTTARAYAGSGATFYDDQVVAAAGSFLPFM